ncbi:MAG: hypothetical protein ACLS69_02240 [Butyricicoccus sp.]
MKARVLFGVFGFAFVLLALYVFPPIVLELVVAVLCVFATYEVLGSTKLVHNRLELLSRCRVARSRSRYFTVLPLDLTDAMRALSPSCSSAIRHRAEIPRRMKVSQVAWGFSCAARAVPAAQSAAHFPDELPSRPVHRLAAAARGVRIFAPVCRHVFR